MPESLRNKLNYKRSFKKGSLLKSQRNVWLTKEPPDGEDQEMVSVPANIFIMILEIYDQFDAAEKLVKVLKDNNIYYTIITDTFPQPFWEVAVF